MNELCKKKTALKTKRKTKTKVIASKKMVDKRCKKKYDVRASYKWRRTLGISLQIEKRI